MATQINLICGKHLEKKRPINTDFIDGWLLFRVILSHFIKKCVFSNFSCHVSLTSDVSVEAEQSGTDEPTPAAEAQTEEKGRDDESADEELCSTSAVLENIPERLNQEFLEMLVENVLKDPDSPSASQSFTLEVIPGTSSAVVTFQSGKGTHLVCVCVFVCVLVVPKSSTYTDVFLLQTFKDLQIK